MADRKMTPLSLETALIELGGAIEFPAPSAGLAARVRERVEREHAQRPPSARVGAWWQALFPGRPLRRAVVLALIALLVLAAIAAAVGLGVPGIRIVFAPSETASPEVSSGPSPTRPVTTSPSGPIGSDMGLGLPIALADAGPSVGFAPRLPAGVGSPAAVYLQDQRLTLVWAPGPGLPVIEGTRLGLLVTEFRGRVDEGYFEKTVRTPGTTVTPVDVNGRQAYWITGDQHFFFYVDPSGVQREETRRLVGDVLIWADDELTFRLETSLSREQAIGLAESMR